MISAQEITYYIKQIKVLMPLWSENEKRYLKDLTDSITEYAENNPDAQANDIVEYYGTPADAVHDYIESCDADILIKKISTKKLVKRISATVLIILLIAFAIFAVSIYKVYLDAENAIVTNTETVISDK